MCSIRSNPYKNHLHNASQKKKKTYLHNGLMILIFLEIHHPCFLLRFACIQVGLLKWATKLSLYIKIIVHIAKTLDSQFIIAIVITFSATCMILFEGNRITNDEILIETDPSSLDGSSNVIVQNNEQLSDANLVSRDDNSGQVSFAARGETSSGSCML